MLAHDFSLIFYSFMAAFIGWPVCFGVYRLFHPYRCKCGRWHWWANAMMEHLEMKHVRDGA